MNVYLMCNYYTILYVCKFVQLNAYIYFSNTCKENFYIFTYFFKTLLLIKTTTKKIFINIYFSCIEDIFFFMF